MPAIPGSVATLTGASSCQHSRVERPWFAPMAVTFNFRAAAVEVQNKTCSNAVGSEGVLIPIVQFVIMAQPQDASDPFPRVPELIYRKLRRALGFVMKLTWVWDGTSWSSQAARPER